MHTAYTVRDVTYQYFGCQYAKEQLGDEKCSRRYIREDDLNAVVWAAIRKLLDLTDAFQKKVERQRKDLLQDNRNLADQLAGLQKEKEGCEAERFSNVDQFMAGNLDKDVYQRRRAELVQALIEKVIVTDPEHVEIRWKFGDTLSVRQNDGPACSADLSAAFVSCIMEYIRNREGEPLMGFNEQIQLLQTIIEQQKAYIQMQEARMAEKDATIADLRKLVDELQSLKANLEETLNEFRRQFFGISSEKTSAASKKPAPSSTSRNGSK